MTCYIWLNFTPGFQVNLLLGGNMDSGSLDWLDPKASHGSPSLYVQGPKDRSKDFLKHPNNFAVS